MTIGMTNWAENIAVANLWKILLAERGYQAELRTVDRSFGPGYDRPSFLAGWGSRMGWVLRLVETGVDGSSRALT